MTELWRHLQNVQPLAITSQNDMPRHTRIGTDNDKVVATNSNCGSTK